MQVRPRFETFKIIEQYPFLKDDTNNEICLTLMEVKLPSNRLELIETPYRFWCCIGSRQEQWNNKAISYQSVAYWRDKKRDKLFKGNINGFKIEEIEDGEHRLFDNNYGLRTTFIIKQDGED